MSLASIQRNIASVALFLLPCNALSFGTSVTFGDIFLIVAALLNCGALARINAFQVPFLLALPTLLIATIQDPWSDTHTFLQMIYTFGFVVPMAWCAFANMTPQRIVTILVACAMLNVCVAVCQFMHVIPLMKTQLEVSYEGGTLIRAPGLFNNTTNFAEFVSTLFPLLVLLPTRTIRPVVCLSLLLGAATSASKQMVMGAGGLAYYLHREYRNGFWKAVVSAIAAIGCIYLLFPTVCHDIYSSLDAMFTRRLNAVDNSLEVRMELFYGAVDLIKQRPLLGYGPGKASEDMVYTAGATAHNHILGVCLTGGVFSAFFFGLGMVYLVGKLMALKQPEFAFYVFTALCTMQLHAVLRVSQQYVPIVVAAAVIAHLQNARKVRSDASPCRAHSHSRSGYSATPSTATAS